MCPRKEAVTADTPLCPALSQVSYMPDRGKLEVFALRDVPSPLGAKLAVLRLFAGYMQQRLREVRAGGGQWAWGGGSGTGRWRGLRPSWLGLSSGRGSACAHPVCPPRPLPAALPCIPAGPAAALQRWHSAGERGPFSPGAPGVSRLGAACPPGPRWLSQWGSRKQLAPAGGAKY